MLKLLNIEFRKLVPYRTFWVITSLYCLFIPTTLYSLGQFKLDGSPFPIDFASMYRFPNIWNNITYIASWFNLLLIGLLVIILVSNEFKFKTFRQHVIDGQSRLDFFKGKMLLILTLSSGSTIYLFFVALLFGFGFTNSVNQGDSFTDIYYLLIYFVQTFGYMIVALLIGVLIRNSALSIIIFIFSIFIENIIKTIIKVTTNLNITDYFPMEIISNLTPVPFPKGVLTNQIKNEIIKDSVSMQTSVIIAVTYIVIFSAFSYWLIEKKDIK